MPSMERDIQASSDGLNEKEGGGDSGGDQASDSGAAFSEKGSLSYFNNRVDERKRIPFIN